MLEFRAPLDFDRAVLAEYQEAFKMAQAWKADLFNMHLITTVVCSPADRTHYSAKWLDNRPALRILATASTGTNHIDLEACAARGIKVLSLLDDRAGLNTISASAEWTFKLILEGLRLKRPYHELQGRTVGLVGFGRIGEKVREYLIPFDYETAYIHDPHRRLGGFIDTALGQLFLKCNVIVICCALTDETRGMITYDLLRRLPPDAVLVNTARGEIVNEADLCRFMAARPDVRVCLDVVAGEVDGTANPERLRQLGAYVTDHIAGETYESRTKAARIILGLLKKEMAHAA